jgi:elongation factor Ts
VGKLLKQNNATVASFVRFEVGEGIEKKQEDFAAEVEAQVRASQ